MSDWFNAAGWGGGFQLLSYQGSSYTPSFAYKLSDDSTRVDAVRSDSGADVSVPDYGVDETNVYYAVAVSN